MPKQVYGYDRNTKEYTGTQSAPDSPREPGVYLIPANSTELEPPAAGEHQAACFVDGAWLLKADYRGEKYYSTVDQSEHEIKELGVDPDATWTDIAPTDSAAEWDSAAGAWVVPFATVLKERKRRAIWAAGDAELAAIKTNYTQAEIESWSKQEQGAKDITAGSTTTDAAVFVANIAAARQISTATLVSKILANVAAYGALSAAVIGQQQRLDTAITAAATQAALDAVMWTK